MRTRLRIFSLHVLLKRRRFKLVNNFSFSFVLGGVLALCYMRYLPLVCVYLWSYFYYHFYYNATTIITITDTITDTCIVTATAAAAAITITITT